MLSVKYHDIFDYKLIKSDFPKWRYKKDITPLRQGSEGLAGIKSRTRIQREEYSKEKLKIAKKASQVLAKIPTIKFVGITGSLAMMNANKDSDIDLMIITSSNSLWTTRLLVYCSLIANRYSLGNKQDALCLNIWLDENDLIWRDRNLYTAHEIAQIVPLVNKDKTYEKFLWKNKWILDFWPNAVSCKPLAISDQRLEKKLLANYYSLITLIIEKIAFNLQILYMSKKITRETVTKTRALFHPQDWGKVVLDRLKAY